jgi:signal transduction histidine kinase/CheY-like chemotaxis protein
LAEDDFLKIIDDEVPPPERGPRWKIAVIDDDPAVHDRARSALAGLVLHGRRLEILSASSAAEGRDLMSRHPDIAALLLAVTVTDGAGRDLLDYIRNTLGNEAVRIILRTGQPGEAADRRIIAGYDINDCKATAELTTDHLFTTLTAALASYRQLRRMSDMRHGLEVVTDAAQTLCDFNSAQRLAEGILIQTASLLKDDCSGILVLRESGEDAISEDAISVLAGSGIYRGLRGVVKLEPPLSQAVRAALHHHTHQFLPLRAVLYIQTAGGGDLAAVVECCNDLSERDRALIEVCCSPLAAAFDNITLHEQLAQPATGRARQHMDEEEGADTLSVQWTRLLRANAFKSEVLRIVAHDLRNPLGVILGRAEMLSEMVEDGASPPHSIKAQLTHIRNAAQRVMVFIEHLIADATGDALDISIRLEPVDLVALLRDLVEANQPLAVRKRQTITFAASAAIELMCDADRIREAVDNLLGNAIKYSPTGGRIDVAVDRGDLCAVIRITDQGPGLSAADVARLFGRFQRLSAKPTGGESSTGLGLSIVKRIVDLHGGTVAAETTGPSGTTFKIAIPSASGKSSNRGI